MDIKNVFGTFVTGFLARQGTEELKAWTPRLTDKLIRFAVARLPVEERERFDEEWRSHVADVPGEIGKLAVASGCVFAAARISLEGKLSLADMGRALDRAVLSFCVPFALGLYTALCLVVLLGWAFTLILIPSPEPLLSLFTQPPQTFPSRVFGFLKLRHNRLRESLRFGYTEFIIESLRKRRNRNRKK